jgi:uncharacterized repeat protein (TIGR04076 family)
MFKVKATLIEFLGDPVKYPCHFQHKIGDEVIFDGEKYIGRLCSDLWPLIVPKVNTLWEAGPRYVPSEYYLPFWYAPTSVDDPEKKIYDGLGFSNVLKTQTEPMYHMGNLKPPHAYEWPPYPERTVGRNITVTCHDLRTAPTFLLEAFDLSDKGVSVPYFRRQMVILSKALNRTGIDLDKILNEFSKEEIEGIYPALTPQILVPLIEELQVMDYLAVANRKAHITDKGVAKLNEFKSSLSDEEKSALRI